MNDAFKTIARASDEQLFKLKNSKFYSYAFPVTNEEEIRNILASIKKQHHQARHWCYAWRLGSDALQYRANDDGEPSNTAGAPILGQLKSFDLTNTLIVVVRYFGGVKLGVSGLITSYRTAALLSIEASEIIEKSILDKTVLEFAYPLMNEVMRKIKKHQITISSQNFDSECQIIIDTPLSQTSDTRAIFESIYGVKVSKYS